MSAALMWKRLPGPAKAYSYKPALDPNATISPWSSRFRDGGLMCRSGCIWNPLGR